MARLAAFPEPMRAAQFLDFTAARPDGEKWELLEGELFLNAAPVRMHQRITLNIGFALESARRALRPDWEVTPGIGVRLSDFTIVEPDVMIRPNDALQGGVCDDALVVFEVLSPSTRRNDLEFKRRGYAGLQSLTHCVAVSQERMEVQVFSRADAWARRVMTRPAEAVVFAGLQAQLALAEIYRDLDALLDRSGEESEP